YRGEAADAKSDQFSFCVMLYEALYRQRPFEGPTWQAIAEAVTSGKLRDPPPKAAAPPRARKALLRGLSVDPAERFGSMGELLEALSDEPNVRRRRLAAAGAAAVALAALPLAYRQARGEPGLTCGGAERKLVGVWDGARKGAVREAFLATGKPFAPDAWRGAERALDAYARDWAAARVDACEATHVRGEQSAELLDLRMACLDDRLKEVGALTEVFARADAEVVVRGVGAAQSLTPLGACGDAKALRARVRPPADAAAAAKVEALRGDLARAQALAEAGKYREALPIAAGAVAAAEAIGYRPALAEALVQYGRQQTRSGDVKGAEATFRRSITAADAAGDDVTRAQAYSGLLFNLGTLQAKGEFVPLVNEQAQAALARAGGDPGIDGQRRANLAAALRRQGKFDEARLEYEGALVSLERAFGPESRQVLIGLYGLGNTHLSRKDFDAARAAFQRYLELSERALGPLHPSVAEGLSGLGTVLMVQLHFDEASKHLGRALAIMEGAVGPESQALTPYLDNLGSSLSELGRHEGALDCFRRSLALTEKQLGPEHPLLLLPLTGLGEAYLGLGDHERAIA
ncbi:MAG TPA: tetratricopeptide repeat-containing protein kinase family protein, partial [Polyangiaceae bacterium]|nr:tetratricopeptide repeat-containing protein kinase family protein [Polyangiaceae bacterium]